MRTREFIIKIHVIIISALLLLLVSSRAFSQTKEFAYGGRFNIGRGVITSPVLQQSEERFVYVLGVTGLYRINDVIGIGSDLLFTWKGAGNRSAEQIETGEFSYREDFDLVYAEVPITAQFILPLTDAISFHTYVGPGVDILLSSTTDRTYDDDEYNIVNGYADRKLDNMERFEFIVVYGTGLSLHTKYVDSFFADIRFNRGLTPLGKIGGQDAYSNYFSISTGLLF